jgi:hypothetical protein
MFTKKFIGWSAMGLFVGATAILTLPVVLMLSPALDIYIALDPQAMIVASGVLALTSAVLGLFAFQTSAGKFAVIGGLVLVIAVSLLLSFTTIVRVERSSTQPPSIVSGVEAR